MPRVHDIVERIKKQSEIQDIVLLDYNTNTDIRDISKPLSHAGLVKLYIEGKYPSIEDDIKHYTQTEIEAIKETKKASKKKSKKNIEQTSLFDEI